MSFEKNWYIVPYHIRKLPGMTLALLDIYETIFEFLNCGKPCFLSNQAIMAKTGIKNDKTIREGLSFFERAGVLKRVTKNNKRYIVKVMSVEVEETLPVDNSSQNCTNDGMGGSMDLGGEGLQTRGGGSTDPHNINNIINKKEKSFYDPVETLPSKESSAEKIQKQEAVASHIKEAEKPKPTVTIHRVEKGNPYYQKENYRKANEIKHPFAEQMNKMQDPHRNTVQEWGPGHPAYDRNHTEIRRPDAVHIAALFKNLPNHLRPKRYQNEGCEENNHLEKDSVLQGFPHFPTGLSPEIGDKSTSYAGDIPC